MERRAIEAEREESARRIDSLRAELDGIIEAAAADPPDDEHDVEGASVGFERARVTALLEAERRRLTELEEALARHDAGAYGRCESCGGEIPAERLAALPAARTCIACARLQRPARAEL